MKKLDKNIALIGFMGTGKSTVAKELSRITGIKYIETDEEIEKQEGKTIAKIFEEEGEEYFRNCETRFLENLKNEKNIIISCGGGIVLRKENIILLKNYCKVILLTSCSQNVYNRVKNCKNRPILNDNMTVQYIENLQNIRRKFYEQAADVIIPTEEKTPIEIAGYIERCLSEKEHIMKNV